MADVLVKILEPAESFSLMTPDQVRLMSHITADDPSGSDEFLTQLIEVNSDIISTRTNRIFARERVRETWRCLGEPCDCPDGKFSRRIFLTHWPVREEDIEAVEVPRGTQLDRDCWELDEYAGRLSIFCGTRVSGPLFSNSEPIVVQYWGGYELPDEAPPALRRALMLLVGEDRVSAEREGTAVRMAGIKSISHKESRVMYETGGITTTTGTGGGGGAMTPALAAAEAILAHFTRRWM